MTRALHLLRRFIDRASGWVTVIACASLFIAMLHIVADALLMRFLHRPIEGTFQVVTMYYMVALFFLPLAYAERADAHISADLVFTLLPPRGKRVVAFLSQLMMTVFAGVLTWQAWLQAERQTRLGAFEALVGFDFPTWPSRWIAVVGLGAFTLVAALRLVESLVSPLALEPDLEPVEEEAQP